MILHRVFLTFIYFRIVAKFTELCRFSTLFYLEIRRFDLDVKVFVEVVVENYGEKDASEDGFVEQKPIDIIAIL